MKKRILFFCLVFLVIYSICSQEGELKELRTDHYVICIENGAEDAAESLSMELEYRFAVFNALFRFDASALPPLRAKVFVDEGEYYSYINEKSGIEKGDAIYLHFDCRENRELVVYRGNTDNDEDAMLAHQSFVQFFRGFIANPPEWMLEGLAIYFSTVEFDPVEGQLSYEENLSFLEEAKTIEKNAGGIKTILQADARQLSAQELRDFQIRSWALASFFLISGMEEYYRTLTECFMLLSAEGTAAENNMIVQKHLSDWNDLDLMENNYQLYVNARKTYDELVEEGRVAYSEENYDYAKLNFIAALERRDDRYAPYYYLGLIYYSEGNYETADEFYRASLACGADDAAVSFALGVNAVQAGNNDDAIFWLRRASAGDSARYGSRVDDLVSRLPPEGSLQ